MFVGTHECHQKDEVFDGVSFDIGEPLGIPASKNLKKLRLFIHQMIKNYNRRKSDLEISKNNLYDLFAAELGVSNRDAHIARLNFDQCLQVARFVYERWVK